MHWLKSRLFYVFYDYFLTVLREILGPLSALYFLYFGVDFFSYSPYFR